MASAFSQALFSGRYHLAGPGTSGQHPEENSQDYELWTIALKDPDRLLHSWTASLDAAGAPGGDLLRHQATNPRTIGADPAGLNQVPVPFRLQRHH